ncbi:hypothetical protein HOA59_03695 [archaeon]|jgi:hypothetical protein|nr:hypothetical protein [archaeon]MBT7106787.1 hypothetical protein [archaeon]MBT7297293.1 hypothetical protein [archaeon]
MVLSDFILDIESNKMISSFIVGAYTGLIGEIADLDSLVKDKKFISDSSEVNVEFSKNVISGVVGLGHIDYSGSLIGDFGELSVYGLSARLGYNFTSNLVKKIKNHQ